MNRLQQAARARRPGNRCREDYQRRGEDAATGAEEATSEEAAVNEGKPAHIATMDKPAKPPNRLNEQFAVISAVFVQEPEEPCKPGKPE